MTIEIIAMDQNVCYTIRIVTTDTQQPLCDKTKSGAKSVIVHSQTIW